MGRRVILLFYRRFSKQGRFGIGFNSVYHLTELPAFVSAGKWCSFDPQANFLPNVNPSNPGKMVDFIQHPETVKRYPDQVRGVVWPKKGTAHFWTGVKLLGIGERVLITEEGESNDNCCGV